MKALSNSSFVATSWCVLTLFLFLLPCVRNVAEAAQFEDVTHLLGPLVPDFTYGATWADIDNDSWPDLFLTNHNQRPPYVLRNVNGGPFSNVSVASGMAVAADHHVCKWGDYDRDDDWDVYCTTGDTNGAVEKPARFYRNRGNGTFDEIAQSSNTAVDGRGRTVSWLDIEGDGDLDVYVGTLVDAPLQPLAKLFRNDGATFTDVTASSGLALNGTVQSSVVLDLDQDNDQDLLVSFLAPSGQTVPCSVCLVFLRNDGSGSFTVQRAGTFGLNGSKAWALALGDFDNDGDLDVFQGNGWSAALHRNDNQVFTSRSLASVGMAGVTAWRIEDAHWADFDNDGYLDLFVVRNDANDVTNPPDVLYLNNGNGTFRDATTEFNAAGSTIGNGDAIAVADFDRNGFLDVLVANGEGNAHGGYRLLRNTGNSNRWLRVSPKNAQGGAEFGAKVLLRIGTQWQYREFLDNGNKASHEPVLHFGLGTRSLADQIRIEWPDGSTSELVNIGGNQTIEVESGGGPGNVTVPDVVGLTQAAAATAITDASLDVGSVTTAGSDTVAAGHVISQDPGAGSSVGAGTDVDLVVSTGPAGNGAYLDFDGANDRVVVPNAASLRLSSAVTVEAWIRPQIIANNANQDRVVRKGINYELTTTTGNTPCLPGSRGHVQWSVTISGTNRRICGGVLSPGTWYHLAGTYDGTTIALYVNGTRVANIVRAGQLTADDKALVIGNNEAGNRGFDGAVDSVAVWNRALSASEVLARVTHALAGNEANLVSYWSFNEPSGQTVFDAAGNSNHGRLGTTQVADSADPSRQVASP